MRHNKKKKKQKKLTVVLFACLLAGVVYLAWPSKTVAPSVAPNNTLPKTNDKKVETKQLSTKKPSYDKTQYSVNVSSSLWVVVNKGRILPATYVPNNLVVPNVPLRYSSAANEMHVRADTAAAMELMFAAAKQQSINLKLASGYRSYGYQVSVYNGYANADGVAKADTYSARPGHSEHQTGLAADLEPVDRTCEIEVCFESTAEGQWLAANAYKFGFIIRYPKNSENLTGYQYEPWHIRYIGTGLASQLHAKSQTLEQFFGLPAYTSYPTNSYQLK